MHSTLISFNEALIAFEASIESPAVYRQPSETMSSIAESARPTWVLRDASGNVLARVDADSGTVHGMKGRG